MFTKINYFNELERENSWINSTEEYAIASFMDKENVIEQEFYIPPGENITIPPKKHIVLIVVS